MVLSIAWKNVWRNKTRSMVVITAITLGLIGGIFSSAIMFGMSDGRVKDAIKHEVSHLQIHNPKYQDNQEIQYTINNLNTIIYSLDTMKAVKAYTTRIKIPAMIQSSNTGTGANIIGINPEEEKIVTNISELISDSTGSFFETKIRYPVVIGQKIAEKLKIHLRSKILIQLQNTDGSITGGSFRVVGIFNSNNTMFEEQNLFVRKKDLAAIAGLSKSSAHEIAISLYNMQDAQTVANTLQLTFPDQEIKTWKKLQPDIAMLNDLMNNMMMLFMIIILLALGFGIINTMLMVVVERIKEIGMLMAIGMNKTKIFFMIMLETIFLSATGGVIGMIISYGLVSFFNSYGIDLSIVGKGLESIGYASIIYPTLHLDFYFTLSILIIITGIISSIYPARKALKYSPIDAIGTD